MNKAKSVIAVGATLFGWLTFGGVAGAAQDPGSDRQAPRPAATCSTGWVEVDTDRLNVRSGPGTNYGVIDTVYRGDLLACGWLEAGGRYSACGVTNANGWIAVDLENDGAIDGFVASTCVVDAF